MLRVDKASAYFSARDGRTVHALDRVSLTIDEGAIAAIVGANGAGKTSLIRTIAGMQGPAHGRILYRGVEITGWPSHKICDLGIGQARVSGVVAVLVPLELRAAVVRGAQRQELMIAVRQHAVQRQRRGPRSPWSRYLLFLNRSPKAVFRTR